MHALIAAPNDSALWDEWRQTLHEWRRSTRSLLGYDDAIYQLPTFEWISSTFNLGLVMMCDLLFYDGDYQLDAFLKHGEREFGGYDAIILWHAYPRIGFDERNQFDFYRQMPGGLARLRQLVDECHARDVHVYVDYNPWDVGTRREKVSDIDALVDLVRAIDADAAFLDTMSNAANGLREKLDATRPGVSLESEVLVPLEHIHTHPSSWAQGFVDVPGVLRNKWFERRHMQHRIRRWQHDHTPELHTAWMNGTGMVIWENVFGSAVRWCERDKSRLRSMVGIQRHFHALFAGEGWTPLIPTLCEGIYASQWEDGMVRLWTLVNAHQQVIDGDLIRVPSQAGDYFYDLVRGARITPRRDGDHVILSASMSPRGIGCFLAVTHPLPDLQVLLRRQNTLYAQANDDAQAPQFTETLIPPPITHLYLADTLPSGMVAIPAHEFDLRVTFTARECGFYYVPGITPPNLRFENLHRPWTFEYPVRLRRYAIDTMPVTNAQFANFLYETGYMPRHRENFLKRWGGEALPPGLEDHPVVYVSLEDARAYAQWAGKRLPTESEWQHAAQGVEGRRYPWGDVWLPDRCNHGQYDGTTSVARFPQGASPYGCYDMCGNVWEWTESERTDGRTRFAILKGGSYYKAYGSEWYADGGAHPNDFAAKFLLMYSGLDRCATIGFRCAVDVK